MDRTSVSIVAIVVTFCLSTTLALADVWTFETPSQNIQCSVGEDGDPAKSDIECTIINKTAATAKARPKSCNGKWGHTFSMHGKGKVKMLCDGPNDGYRYLKLGTSRAEYGETGVFGGFECHSSTKGLRCKNLDGHGFFLSRKKQDVF